MIRTIFMGTPGFALPTLDALVELPELELIAVYTEPDKPKGRGLKVVPSPVKQWAETHRVPFEQPPGFRQDPAHLATLRSYHPDLIVVAAYGKILPNELIEIPKFGSVNVHASLLPKYRGGSPVQHSLLRNDSETGTTLMVIDEGLDTGPIISQRHLTISPEDNYQSLSGKLALLGAEHLKVDLPRFLAGELKPKPQPKNGASVTKLIEKKDGEIDWSEEPRMILGKIRAFTPWPGAYTFLTDGKRLLATKAHLDRGRLILDRVKLEGKPEIGWSAFLLGYRSRLPETMRSHLSEPT